MPATSTAVPCVRACTYVCMLCVHTCVCVSVKLIQQIFKCFHHVMFLKHTNDKKLVTATNRAYVWFIEHIGIALVIATPFGVLL